LGLKILPAVRPKKGWKFHHNQGGKVTRPGSKIMAVEVLSLPARNLGHHHCAGKKQKQNSAIEDKMNVCGSEKKR